MPKMNYDLTYAKARGYFYNRSGNLENASSNGPFYKELNDISLQPLYKVYSKVLSDIYLEAIAYENKFPFKYPKESNLMSWFSDGGSIYFYNEEVSISRSKYEENIISVGFTDKSYDTIIQLTVLVYRKGKKYIPYWFDFTSGFFITDKIERGRLLFKGIEILYQRYYKKLIQEYTNPTWYLLCHKNMKEEADKAKEELLKKMIR